jgi:hypothetical protein
MENGSFLSNYARCFSRVAERAAALDSAEQSRAALQGAQERLRTAEMQVDIVGQQFKQLMIEHVRLFAAPQAALSLIVGLTTSCGWFLGLLCRNYGCVGSDSVCVQASLLDQKQEFIDLVRQLREREAKAQSDREALQVEVRLARHQ